MKKKKLMKLFMTLTIILGAILMISPIGESFNRLGTVEKITEEEILSETVIAKKNITLTFYNPVRSQCDKDPHITADGSKIDMKKLQNGQLRWCAISRDLFQIYSYGDEIWIESENPLIRGYWVVKDTMAAKKKNCVDLLLPVEHKTGFGKEHTYIKHQMPRYLAEELGWEEHKEKDPHYIENTLSEEDGLSEKMIKSRVRND